MSLVQKIGQCSGGEYFKDGGNGTFLYSDGT